MKCYQCIFVVGDDMTLHKNPHSKRVGCRPLRLSPSMNHFARDAKHEIIHPTEGQPPTVVSRGSGPLQWSPECEDRFLTCILIRGERRMGWTCSRAGTNLWKTTKEGHSEGNGLRTRVHRGEVGGKVIKKSGKQKNQKREEN